MALIGVVVVGAFTYRLLRPIPASSQASGATAQFRIWVGLKDTQPKDWNGKISTTGADLVAVKGLRFSQQDRADNDGSFHFRTKRGNLENQLLTAHPYGATDWSDPTAQRLIPEGLAVRFALLGQGRLKRSTSSEATSTLTS
jgi:hypothetical protein